MGIGLVGKKGREVRNEFSHFFPLLLHPYLSHFPVPQSQASGTPGGLDYGRQKAVQMQSLQLPKRTRGLDKIQRFLANLKGSCHQLQLRETRASPLPLPVFAHPSSARGIGV